MRRIDRAYVGSLESREQFDKFAQEQIGPITQEVGVPGPPEITFFDVHNYLTAG